MAFPTNVDSQITDSVTEGNKEGVIDSPAVAMGNLYVAASQALSIAAQNATDNQQQINVIVQASTAKGVAVLLDTTAASVVVGKILGD